VPVKTDAVGKPYPAVAYAVGREKVKEYAAAVGETNPVHLDPAAKLPFDQPGDETLEAQRQGGFPGLAGAQHREALAGAHEEIEAVKDRPGSFFVAEIELGDGDYGRSSFTWNSHSWPFGPPVNYEKFLMGLLLTLNLEL